MTNKTILNNSCIMCIDVRKAALSHVHYEEMFISLFRHFSKGLSNVSSTCSSCPKYVLSKLRRALRRKGIMCRQKG